MLEIERKGGRESDIFEEGEKKIAVEENGT